MTPFQIEFQNRPKAPKTTVECEDFKVESGCLVFYDSAGPVAAIAAGQWSSIIPLPEKAEQPPARPRKRAPKRKVA